QAAVASAPIEIEVRGGGDEAGARVPKGLARGDRTAGDQRHLVGVWRETWGQPDRTVGGLSLPVLGSGNPRAQSDSSRRNGGHNKRLLRHDIPRESARRALAREYVLASHA